MGKTVTAQEVSGIVAMLDMIPTAEERHDFEISDNFDWWEFWSGDPELGEKSVEPPQVMWPDAVRHMLNVQHTRDYLGFGIRYSSGYRTLIWNTIWKGGKTSNHMICKAGDLVPVRRMNIRKFAMIVSITTEFDGFGVYGGFHPWTHGDFDRLDPLLYKW